MKKGLPPILTRSSPSWSNLHLLPVYERRVAQLNPEKQTLHFFRRHLRAYYLSRTGLIAVNRICPRSFLAAILTYKTAVLNDFFGFQKVARISLLRKSSTLALLAKAQWEIKADYYYYYVL